MDTLSSNLFSIISLLFCSVVQLRNMEIEVRRAPPAFRVKLEQTYRARLADTDKLSNDLVCDATYNLCARLLTCLIPEIGQVWRKC